MSTDAATSSAARNANSGIADGCRCPRCGLPVTDADEPVIRRGAVMVGFDPVAVWWRGIHVPLSPTEALVYAHVARRSRVETAEIDEVLENAGASAATRTLVLGHIRRKFLDLGACDPFERLGTSMLRLRVDPDAGGSRAPVIGARASRYARSDDAAPRARPPRTWRGG